MNVTLIAFGIAKEILGGRQINYELPSTASVKDLLEDLASKYPRLEHLASLKVAVNSEYAEMDQQISETDEIVLIPPVSGG